VGTTCSSARKAPGLGVASRLGDSYTAYAASSSAASRRPAAAEAQSSGSNCSRRKDQKPYLLRAKRGARCGLEAHLLAADIEALLLHLAQDLPPGGGRRFRPRMLELELAAGSVCGQ
jgi:hypothetical protein